MNPEIHNQNESQESSQETGVDGKRLGTQGVHGIQSLRQQLAKREMGDEQRKQRLSGMK